MNKKYLLLSCCIAISFVSTAQAYTYFTKNKSPSQVRNFANFYQHQYGYSVRNNLHPYSRFQNPYNANSVRNNGPLYSQPVRSFGSKQSYGYINNQIIHQKSINNPYSTEGSVYNKNHPAYPYGINKPYNPYSKHQNPYNPNSVRNNPIYGVQYQGSYGKSVSGVRGSYYNSPYNNDSIENPYGTNKNIIP